MNSIGSVMDGQRLIVQLEQHLLKSLQGLGGQATVQELRRNSGLTTAGSSNEVEVVWFGAVVSLLIELMEDGVIVPVDFTGDPQGILNWKPSTIIRLC